MDIEEITRYSLLYDFYGQLLSRRQREVAELYIQENYSLAEIAEQFGISRQSVHDALRSGRKSLLAYEEKLGLVDRFIKTDETIRLIDSRMTRLKEGISEGRVPAEKIPAELEKIRSVIDRLEE